MDKDHEDRTHRPRNPHRMDGRFDSGTANDPSGRMGYTNDRAEAIAGAKEAANRQGMKRSLEQFDSLAMAQAPRQPAAHRLRQAIGEAINRADKAGDYVASLRQHAGGIADRLLGPAPDAKDPALAEGRANDMDCAPGTPGLVDDLEGMLRYLDERLRRIEARAEEVSGHLVRIDHDLLGL